MSATDGHADPAATAFEAAVDRHDARVAALGLTIWAGSEPTFTDRNAQSPEWLNQALGGEKEQRARALIDGLQRRFPGALVLHTVGRQYPGEERPRWNLGLYRRRNGEPVWPAWAPAGTGETLGNAADSDVWAAAVRAELAARGWQVSAMAGLAASERRLLVRIEAAVPPPDGDDPRLLRPPVQCRTTPAGGLRDELAEAGIYLLTLDVAEVAGRPETRVELPMFACVATFLTVLECLARACVATGLPAPVLTGYPPPVDGSIEWTTVTPDPAVIEINTAPSVGARDFLGRSRAIYAAAAEQGLAPYRLYYNGAVADSGGGGQITLGGPSPEASPFLVEPLLLPRLVRFFNRHPALSYLYSHDYVGGGGQSVRADERGADSFEELQLALKLLEQGGDLSPERLWHGLASFLCDASGNSHRAEMNIEKLWNPFLGSRGRQGLVEFRALRMQHSPERATALVCLLRAVVAMLARGRYTLPMMDWGRELHDRFSLPFYLEQDLETVLAALDSAGLGLDEAILALLRRDEFRAWGEAALPGCIVELRRALEFWPLLGDAASPEQGGGSRLVDASTARVELRLRPGPGGAPDWHDWQASVAGVRLPMRLERDARGEVKVFGLRYRSFVPGWGLHPGLGTQVPVQVSFRHPGTGDARLLTLHEWRPDGGAYPGLPVDLADAARRRAERVAVQAVAGGSQPTAEPGAVRGLGAFCLDLRWLEFEELARGEGGLRT